MKSKFVYVEVTRQPNLFYGIVRIFRNQKAALASDAPVIVLHRDVAVAEIRHQLWLRCKGVCELCGDTVTEGSGHMHEQKHRGQGGEISMDNSVFVCAKTHKQEHRDREPRWSRHDS